MATLSLYFNGYSAGEAWTNSPANMVDSDEATYASSATSGQVQLLNTHTYADAIFGPITKVEIRCYGYKSAGVTGSIGLRPVFSAGDGATQTFTVSTSPAWSSWFDITAITNAPSPWTWAALIALDCDVIATPASGRTIYCGKVELQITYTAESVPAGEASASAPAPAVSGESGGANGEVTGVAATCAAAAPTPMVSGECILGPPAAMAGAAALAPIVGGGVSIGGVVASASAAALAPELAWGSTVAAAAAAADAAGNAPTVGIGATVTAVAATAGAAALAPELAWGSDVAAVAATADAEAGVPVLGAGATVSGVAAAADAAGVAPSVAGRIAQMGALATHMGQLGSRVGAQPAGMGYASQARAPAVAGVGAAGRESSRAPGAGWLGATRPQGPRLGSW